MTNQEYIDNRLATYNEAFDFYMDCGEMPKSIEKGDILGAYLKSVIDSNPQLDSQDPLWMEVLKDDLLAFLSAMLSAFVPVEEAHKKEQAYIGRYKNADLDKQRELWPSVYEYVSKNYEPTDVNIAGYVEQFKENNVQDVIDALCEDWMKASDSRKDAREKKILEKNAQSWERHIKEWGLSDYKRRKKIDNTYYRYPALQEIVKIIGREQPQRKDEKDDITYKYIPILLSTRAKTVEIEQISIGDDVAHMMPIETAILSDQETETLFYKKFAGKQLQIFANRPPLKSQDKQIQQHQTKPRLEMGPIIVSIDTSGSMSGKPEEVAHSLLIQLLRLAKKKKRKCFVITFSVRSRALELTNPANWRKLNKFLEEGFSGGTDGEEMLNSALDALQKKDFCMADVLIISDFEFPLPKSTTKARMRAEHDKGTRFYGLQIGSWPNRYQSILDKMWKMKI